MQITHDNDCEHRLGHDCTCGASSYQFDLAAARAEIERLTKERDAQYDENVHRIAMQAKAEAERDEALALLADAYGAGTGGSVIESRLADAERDMRQRAADKCRQDYDAGNDLTGHQYADAILALPLKYADREGGV